MYAYHELLHPNLIASNGFCPPFETNEPPKKTTGLIL